MPAYIAGQQNCKQGSSHAVSTASFGAKLAKMKSWEEMARGVLDSLS